MTEDKPRKPWRCFDCEAPWVDYYVRDEVWLQAWPDYPEFKKQIVQRYRGTEKDRLQYLTLCFDCLVRRLGRKLTAKDFDLALPANHGIRFGMTLVEKS